MTMIHRDVLWGMGDVDDGAPFQVIPTSFMVNRYLKNASLCVSGRDNEAL